MWKLESDNGKERSYLNSATGSKCKTSKIYTDNQGNDWYGFVDLMEIPYTRQFAATKVSSLYALGLSKDDLNIFFTKHKLTLKSNDPEKYEKAYSELLDFQNMVENATDTVKQLSSLVCVYYMLSNEIIDSFENSMQLRKLSILESDPNAHAFFLSRQIEDIEAYTLRLKQLSETSLQSRIN